MRTPALPHQAHFLETLGALPVVCNAAEPGLGKTWMALAWLERQQARRTLWLTVAAYVGGTVAEVERLSGFKALTDLQGRVRCTRPGSIYVISYDHVRRHSAALGRMQDSFDAVVADESEALKRIQSKRTRAAVRSLDRIPKRTILTGTLVTQSLFDIWAQFLFLDGGQTLGRSYIDFRTKYYMARGPFEWVAQPWALERIKALIAPKTFWCRKEDCLKLPAVQKRHISVPLHSKVRPLYEQLAEDFTVSLPSGQTIDTTFIVQKLMRMHQLVSGAFVADDKSIVRMPCTKRDALKVMLEQLPGQKVLVWCRFRFEVEDVARIADNAGYATYRVAGEDDPTPAVYHFQTTSKRAVCVLTLTKGARALTLTAADTSIYYNRDGSVGRRLQSVDRNYRIGSERHDSIKRYDLFTRGTLEETMLLGLGEKLTEAIKARRPQEVRRYLLGK